MGTPTAQCLKRLQLELRKLGKEPDAGYQVGADPHNMLHCYFVLNGPEGTPYAGGRYIGLLEIPSDYPFKPPSVQLCTPSGRFRTGMAICLSNSSYHPEQWSPMWGLHTILIALVSFFVSEEKTTGSMESSPEERRRYAAESRSYNVNRMKVVYKRVLPAAYEADVAFLAQEAAQQQQSKAAGEGESSSSSSASDNEEEETNDTAEHAAKAAKTSPAASASGGGGASSDGRCGDGAGQSKPTEAAHEDEGVGKDARTAEASGQPTQQQQQQQQQRRHHHHHRHPASGMSREPSENGVSLLGGVPWRRLASLMVLLAVGVALVGQLR